MKGWQGKEGPCELLVWRQGEQGPVDQRVDDKWRLSAEKLKRFRLTALFQIYTTCCGLHAYAVCTAADGVWTETRLLLEPEDVAAELFSDELNDKRAALRDLDSEENGKTGKRK